VAIEVGTWRSGRIGGQTRVILPAAASSAKLRDWRAGNSRGLGKEGA